MKYRKHRFQTCISCLLALLLMLASASSLAEVRTWEFNLGMGITIYYGLTGFDAELPDALQDAMAKTRWADWQCVKGIRMDEMEKEGDAIKSGTALIAAQKDGRTMLLQFLSEDGKAWKCLPAAEEKALLTGRAYEFGAILDLMYPSVQMIYPCDDGGREVFLLRLSRNEQRPAIVVRYSREYADGSALIIGGGEYGDTFFHMESILASGDVAQAEDLPYLYPRWLEALDADHYPKTMEEARGYAAADPRTVAEGYGILTGPNVRKKASSHSENLGVYRRGVMAKILGTEPGQSWFWYQVQIGQTVGFVSEPYLYEGANAAPWYYDTPLAVGRADKDCELKSAPGSGEETVAALPKGAVMYVLAERGDWLHVCVPQGELGYWMGDGGTYGYLRSRDVTQAYTPLQLKYTDD